MGRVQSESGLKSRNKAHKQCCKRTQANLCVSSVEGFLFLVVGGQDDAGGPFGGRGFLSFSALFSSVCVNNNILNMFAFCFFAAHAGVYAIYFCTFFAPFCSAFYLVFFFAFPARLQSMPAGWAMYNLCLSLASYRLSLELNS